MGFIDTIPSIDDTWRSGVAPAAASPGVLMANVQYAPRSCSSSCRSQPSTATAGAASVEPVNVDLSDYVSARRWVKHPKRPEKKKTAPIFTEQRAQEKWDALSTEAQDRIRKVAKDRAAEAMAAFTVRSGR